MADYQPSASDKPVSRIDGAKMLRQGLNRAMQSVWGVALLTLGVCVALFFIARALFVPRCGRNRVAGCGNTACAHCFDDADCGTGYRCKVTEYDAGSGLSRADQASANACVSCLTDADCNGETTCQSDGSCRQACTGDQDCTVFGHVCDSSSGTCHPPQGFFSGSLIRETPSGSDEATCKADGGVWAPDVAFGVDGGGYRCVACDPQWYAGEGFCDAAGRVVQCLSNKHCGEGLACDNAIGACLPPFSSLMDRFEAGGLVTARGTMQRPLTGEHMTTTAQEGVTAMGRTSGANVLLAWRPDAPSRFFIAVRGKRGMWHQLRPTFVDHGLGVDGKLDFDTREWRLVEVPVSGLTAWSAGEVEVEGAPSMGVAVAIVAVDHNIAIASHAPGIAEYVFPGALLTPWRWIPS